MKKRTILVCPLNWGLGHAGRDICLIKKLIEKDMRVILGGDGPSIEFLHSEFPGLKVVRIPSHNFYYSKIFPAWLMIILQIPAFIKGILTEHKYLKRITDEYDIDLVISDARYGLWNPKIPSVILTHQVRIRMPFLFKLMEAPFNLLNLSALGKFSRLLIPDFPGHPNLSGALSHNTRLPSHSFYKGLFSRFTEYKSGSFPDEIFEVAILISGPEPQRSLFETKVTRQVIKQGRKTIIIGGRAGVHMTENLNHSCRRISFLSGNDLFSVLKYSRYIICRSGYSTIMDLVALGRTALLVPTPGQTEQEYLADYFQKQGFFLYSKQKDFNLEEAIQRLEKFVPVKFIPQENISSDEIMKLLSDLMGD